MRHNKTHKGSLKVNYKNKIYLISIILLSIEKECYFCNLLESSLTYFIYKGNELEIKPIKSPLLKAFKKIKVNKFNNEFIDFNTQIQIKQFH